VCVSSPKLQSASNIYGWKAEARAEKSNKLKPKMNTKSEHKLRKIKNLKIDFPK